MSAPTEYAFSKCVLYDFCKPQTAYSHKLFESGKIHNRKMLQINAVELNEVHQ
jgi:hypothetical protein